jgi:hypothetical protein
MAQNNILQRNAFEMKSKFGTCLFLSLIFLMRLDAALQAREAELELASTEMHRMSEELNATKKSIV